MAIRLRVQRDFGERLVPSETKDPIPFHLISIAGEGLSEEQYFIGIKEYADALGTTDIIKIELLEKMEEYSTMSHPKHLLKLLEERKEYWKEWGILPGELCMIIDRDTQDRSEEQLKEIIEKCQEEGFNIALTNPAFELWLMLHVDDLKTYDRNDLLKNKKISSEKRFLEKELSEKIGGYSKGNLDFAKFEDGILDAIQRANKFENRLEKLIDSLGTNIHHLISILIR